VTVAFYGSIHMYTLLILLIQLSIYVFLNVEHCLLLVKVIFPYLFSII